MRVVAFASDKGGMGKSTAILNLACAAVERGFEVAVLDLDPQASVGRWARMRKKAGLPSRPLAENCVPIDVEDRLSELRAAGADLVFLDTTLGPTFARLWADGRQHFVLLIDWSSGATRLRADGTAAIERAGGTVVPASYTHRSDYRLALEQGQGVTEFSQDSTAAAEIRGVFDWLSTQLSLSKSTNTKAA